jgi:hypoxanthine phosphoribosyltransferase
MTPDEISEVWSRASCLYTHDEVEIAIDAMAGKITERLSHRNPILLCVLQGGLVVTGKLAARLPFLLQLDYLHATRYRERTRGADLQWLCKPTLNLKNRVVLLVDDILDEGETLHQIRNFCFESGSEEVLCAVLIDKQQECRVPPIKADFVGLMAPDRYLFGYGMDYKGYLRNAAGIYAVDDKDL